MTIQELGSVVIVRPESRDLAVGPETSFQTTIREVLSRPSVSLLILDLAQLNETNSFGLAAVVSCYKQARVQGKPMVLVNVQRQVTHLLMVTRLDEIFTIKQTVEEAVAAQV
jgi:anti-anti-sigma factor